MATPHSRTGKRRAATQIEDEIYASSDDDNNKSKKNRKDKKEKKKEKEKSKKNRTPSDPGKSKPKPLRIAQVASGGSMPGDVPSRSGDVSHSLISAKPGSKSEVEFSELISMTDDDGDEEEDQGGNPWAVGRSIYIAGDTELSGDIDAVIISENIESGLRIKLASLNEYEMVPNDKSLLISSMQKVEIVNLSDFPAMVEANEGNEIKSCSGYFTIDPGSYAVFLSNQNFWVVCVVGHNPYA